MTVNQFRILGPVSALHGEAEIAVGPPQRRALFGLLLLAEQQSVTVAQLQDRLWGPERPASCITAIQGHVHHLRRAMRETGRPAAGGPELVSYPGHSREQASYALLTAPATVDFQEARRLAAEGRDHLLRHAYKPALASCRRALSLWRGEPLAGLPMTSYLTIARNGLNEMRRSLRHQAARAELALGRPAIAVEGLQQLWNEEPQDEHTAVVLSVALCRAGAPSRALAIIDGQLERWRAQYGMTPPDMVQHRNRILAGTFDAARDFDHTAEPWW
ncbi:BTAD domain-containing putative transcriptional regulator [Kitasatospora sp. NPDC002551]|uniref:AfsR/SARP family transcriptional regulator n=1 Tax=unclassified Kitasatospora TaxID=2633591 RepID=UPI00332CDBBC